MPEETRPEADRLLARPEVEAMLGMSRATIYNMVRRGDLPAPIRVGPHAVRWWHSEIMAALKAAPRATGRQRHAEKAIA